MPTAPVEEADLPPFTNQPGRCPRCDRRGPIRVHFDRDCPEARAAITTTGVCECGARWVERCRP